MIGGCRTYIKEKCPFTVHVHLLELYTRYVLVAVCPAHLEEQPVPETLYPYTYFPSRLSPAFKHTTMAASSSSEGASSSSTSFNGRLLFASQAPLCAAHLQEPGNYAPCTSPRARRLEDVGELMSGGRSGEPFAPGDEVELALLTSGSGLVVPEAGDMGSALVDMQTPTRAGLPVVDDTPPKRRRLTGKQPPPSVGDEQPGEPFALAAAIPATAAAIAASGSRANYKRFHNAFVGWQAYKNRGPSASILLRDFRTSGLRNMSAQARHEAVAQWARSTIR